MRLDQRDGRAVRLGSRHPCVEVVRFALPPALERALRVEAALRRKRRLPAVAGLGPAGRRLWRWRTGLGEALERGPASAGWAIVRCAPAGVLAGFTLHAPAAGGEMRLAYGLGWNSRDGAWSEDPDTVADRLTAAAAAERCEPDPGLLRSALSSLAAPLRARLAGAQARRWAAGAPAGPARLVAATLQQAIREAARSRDAARLELLERALGFLAGGHTAGEAMLLGQLAASGTAAVCRAAGRFPAPSPGWGAVEARLTGLVVFAPE